MIKMKKEAHQLFYNILRLAQNGKINLEQEKIFSDKSILISFN